MVMRRRRCLDASNESVGLAGTGQHVADDAPGSTSKETRAIAIAVADVAVAVAVCAAAPVAAAAAGHAGPEAKAAAGPTAAIRQAAIQRLNHVHLLVVVLALRHDG